MTATGPDIREGDGAPATPPDAAMPDAAQSLAPAPGSMRVGAMRFTRPRRTIDRVFLHCSASDRPEHDAISVIRDWHVRGRGWRDVGYHYFIRKDGTVEPGRPLVQLPAAQGRYNEGSIAVCLHGLLAENFTTQQFRALIALCRTINDACNGKLRFHGHCEVVAKRCPVFAYRRVLGLDAVGKVVAMATTDPYALAPDATDRPTLHVTTSNPSVRHLQFLLCQRNFAVTVDGIFGHQTLAAVLTFQRQNELTPDGVVGPRTWAALVAGD